MIQNTAEVELKDMETEYFAAVNLGRFPIAVVQVSVPDSPNAARTQRYMD